MVDVQFRRKFRRTITLSELKEHPALEGMPLLQQGQPAVGDAGQPGGLGLHPRSGVIRPRGGFFTSFFVLSLLDRCLPAGGFAVESASL
jgi:hypothetical protein